MLRNKLAEWLSQKGIRQWQLARRLEMSRAYVCRLCNRQIQPSLMTALRIAHCIGVPVGEIFQLADEDAKGSDFPSAPGRGQEHQITPGITNERKVKTW